MRCNFEKDRSAVATFTDKERNRSRADTTSVNVEVRAELSRSPRDDSWAISDLNDDASVTSCTGNTSRRSQLYSFCKAVVRHVLVRMSKHLGKLCFICRPHSMLCLITATTLQTP